MTQPEFDWDEAKAEQNRKKHGVAFRDAATAFRDDHALVMFDPDHSEDEDRFILLGMSASLRLLVVCHCYRDRDRIIRLISARKALDPERRQYLRRKQ